MTSQEIVEALEREAMKRGLEQGLEQGLKQGLAKGLTRGMTRGAARTLAHQFERRLGRALRKDERAILQVRIARLGADRLGDLVLDLSAAELAAWLADPDAR